VGGWHVPGKKNKTIIILQRDDRKNVNIEDESFLFLNFSNSKDVGSIPRTVEKFKFSEFLLDDKNATYLSS
jgi:hypothetical protein